MCMYCMYIYIYKYIVRDHVFAPGEYWILTLEHGYGAESEMALIWQRAMPGPTESTEGTANLSLLMYAINVQ